MKLKVESPEDAVYHQSKYGPTFDVCHDLHVSLLLNINSKSSMYLGSYEFPNGVSGNEGGEFIVGGSDFFFQTVEIEVFQVS